MNNPELNTRVAHDMVSNINFDAVLRNLQQKLVRQQAAVNATIQQIQALEQLHDAAKLAPKK